MLKFSERGKAPDDVRSGFFNLDGGLPVNTDGGLKCFGHPIGASGAMIIVSLLHEMKKRKIKKGLAALCIGGGMGIASLWES